MKRCDQRKGKGEGKVMWGDFRDQERAGGRTRGGGAAEVLLSSASSLSEMVSI